MLFGAAVSCMCGRSESAAVSDIMFGAGSCIDCCQAGGECSHIGPAGRKLYCLLASNVLPASLAMDCLPTLGVPNWRRVQLELCRPIDAELA